MSDFDSLTIALEKWFDKPLSAMPRDVQERIGLDFGPIPWDNISPEQRREVALQRDYQHDPTTEQERQYWWDFYLQKDALKKQIAEWEKAATPTATDLAHKEDRLKELRNELSRMDQQERQPQQSYIPGRTQSAPPSAGASAQTSANYIAYPKAMQLLANRLNATSDELAAWIFYGAEEGGLSAYTNANELNPPPKFFYGYHTGAEDYIAPLMACWFNEEDIANFQPVERYITGTALIERWSKQAGIHPAAFIRAKIAESRLMDMHPTFGGTEATFSSIGTFPSIETGLFALSHVIAIEEDDFAEAHAVLPKSKAPQAFIDAINRLLKEVECRSSAKGTAINKDAMPGTKANLQAVASKFDDALDGFSPQTFDDYLEGICRFKKGRPQTDAKNPYAKLFPEFF